MTTMTCDAVGVASGASGSYTDPGCTQHVLWPTIYSPANLPPSPPPTAVVGNGGSGKIMWSEAPMSAYTTMPVYFQLNPGIAAGTALVITPNVDDPAVLNVPPFTVGS